MNCLVVLGEAYFQYLILLERVGLETQSFDPGIYGAGIPVVPILRTVFSSVNSYAKSFLLRAEQSLIERVELFWST